MDTTTVVQTAGNFGEYAGLALVLLVCFVGFSLLINGWPKFGQKK